MLKFQEVVGSIVQRGRSEPPVRIDESQWEEAWTAFAAWPPNVFALTTTLLEQDALYRLVVSPPPRYYRPIRIKESGTKDPFVADVPDRSRFDEQSNEWLRFWMCTEAPETLRGWLTTAPPEGIRPVDSLPAILKYLGRRLFQISSQQTDSVAAYFAPLVSAREVYPEGAPAALWEQWSLFCVILECHALADHSCRGVGLPSTRERTSSVDRRIRNFFRLRAHLMLCGPTRSLSVFRAAAIVPKMRTPQTGMTLRSLSHNLAAVESEFQLQWHAAAELCDDAVRQLRVLVFPWPFEVNPSFLSAHYGADPQQPRAGTLLPNQFGYFAYSPSEPFDFKLLELTLAAAKRKGLTIDGVILPELAISKGEVETLRKVLGAAGVSFFLAGVRGDDNRLENSAVLGVRGASGEFWRHWQQHKHHRWRLEKRQINTYGLEHQLNPDKTWWERIPLHRRELHFTNANGWLVLCQMICEDLARLDPVADVIRAVGPNLIVALLLDGPQVPQRWSGRFSGVLAEDPGCSVLTVSALGMARLARKPTPDAPSDVIALWSSPTATTPISLAQQDSVGVVLTLTGHYSEEFTADGRSDAANACRIELSRTDEVTRHDVDSVDPKSVPSLQVYQPSQDEEPSVTLAAFVLDAFCADPANGHLLLAYAKGQDVPQFVRDVIEELLRAFPIEAMTSDRREVLRGVLARVKQQRSTDNPVDRFTVLRTIEFLIEHHLKRDLTLPAMQATDVAEDHSGST